MNPDTEFQWPDHVTLPQQLGGKAHALWMLHQAGMKIPEWFVIPPVVIESTSTSTSTTPAAWEDWRPSAELVTAVKSSLATICPHDTHRVAFRSSGRDEDGKLASFAGQFESVLGIDPKSDQQIADALSVVVQSGFTQRVREYRLQHDMAEAPTIPAVLVQRMVNADAAGVGFSADPVTGRRDIAVVCAIRGLGSAMVNGEVNADTFRIGRDGKVIERVIVDKPLCHRMADDGTVKTISVGANKAAMPAIGRRVASQAGHLARQAARHFGRAQDIEWAVEDGRLYLLQSRPITSLGQLSDPSGHRLIWDNSNIAESYAGITSPLTFSFARYVYEHVYRQFCLMMGVPRDVVAANHTLYANMLGTAKGRVYYNLINWYRLLAMLPGFKFNRPFMEQMMGVKEPVPDDVLGITPASRGQKWRDGFALLKTTIGLVASHLTIGRNVSRFEERLNASLAPTVPPLNQMRLDQLTNHYRELEQQLLTRWDAPLVNDFLAMIFHGILRKLTAKWIGPMHGGFHNDLIAHQGSIISAEPAARLRDLAAEALKASDQSPTLLETLATGDMPRINAALAETPALSKMGQDYLRVFGDRCTEELKLESLTLEDAPGPLWQTVAQLATRIKAGQLPDAKQMSQRQEERHTETKQVLATQLKGHPFRKLVYHWVLRNARDRVRDRENLRFGRTRLFGRVRRIMIMAGSRMSENGSLDQPRDIFHLHLEEILGYAEGTLTIDQPASLVQVRKEAYARFAQAPAPADRFETFGAFHQGNRFEASQSPAVNSHAQDPNTRVGLGCSPGVVQGIARVVHDPRGVSLEQGEILVASRTDPGWVLLFPASAGVLVEHGSLLSHSAIVARELGLPAVVSVPGLMTWLNDGDKIEFNGSTGEIRKLTGEQNS